jgi:hypothetical protein
MKAKETIQALERLQALAPLAYRNEIEILFTYIHQQLFIEMEMEAFTQGFGYKPDKELNQKMREWAKKIELAYSDDVDG